MTYNPTTSHKLNPEEFLKLAATVPVIDVRSPKEFMQGHIPGAHNIPLFTDEERARVGVTYARSGNRKAVEKGLEIAGPKLKDFVLDARKLASKEEILVHCWRGGMRSEAMAWLFNFSGLRTRILDGGYRAYRKYIRQSFVRGPELKVLGGMTGCGKTEILHILADMGEQVIDLEALASHKGSAFGGLGENQQPTTEQFENDLAHRWLSFDPGLPAWIEDESLNIGKVVIPDSFFSKMRSSAIYLIEMPVEKRIERLVKEYGSYDKSLLLNLIAKVSRRMGGEASKKATESLMENNLKGAVEILLHYYDKAYCHSLKTRENQDIRNISADVSGNYHVLAGYLRTIR